MTKQRNQKSLLWVKSLITAAHKVRPPVDELTYGVDTALNCLPHKVMMVAREDQGGWSTSFHHRFVWMIFLQGDGGVAIDGHLYPLQPGQSVLIFPYQSHYRIRSDAACEWLLIRFEISEVKTLLPLSRRILSLSSLLADTLSALIEHYVETREGKTGQWQSIAPAYLSLALTHLLAEAQLEPRNEGPTLTSVHQALVRDAVRMISQSLDKPLFVQDICDALGITEKKLRDLVHRTFNTSPKRLMLHLKMNRAIEMLSVEGRSVKEAAFALGFESPYAFSRSFKRVVGKAPKTFKGN